MIPFLLTASPYLEVKIEAGKHGFDRRIPKEINRVV